MVLTEIHRWSKKTMRPFTSLQLYLHATKVQQTNWLWEDLARTSSVVSFLAACWCFYLFVLLFSISHFIMQLLSLFNNQHKQTSSPRTHHGTRTTCGVAANLGNCSSGAWKQIKWNCWKTRSLIVSQHGNLAEKNLDWGSVAFKRGRKFAENC